MISARDIAKFFEEIEMRLAASLKRNLSRHKQEEKDEGFEWSAWQAEKLRSVDKFRKENSDIVGEYTEVIDKETRELMQEQFREGEKLAEETIKKALGADVSKKLSTEPVPQFFGVDSNKVDSLIQDITTLEKHVETAALRMTDDVYRQTLHRTQLALSTGSMTLEQAIDISVKDFLEKGINCIVYKDGRRVNIADYVRMALRTTETRAKLQGMSKRAQELGYDTVLVSQYSMCSDTCLPWQGRVYIDDVFVLWNGEIEERNDVELWGKSHYCGKWFPLLSTAVHKGLFHPNCRHSITVWIEGVSVLPAKLDGAEIKKKSALEQQQRRLENEVRKAKRLVEGTLDSDNVKENKRKLREVQKKLKEFTDEHPDILRRDYNREKIYTADTRKAVDKSRESGIIKSEGVTELEQAKKRDHKIRINDIAISRVDYVKPSDFTDEQAKSMQLKHKELLKVAMDSNDSNEVLMISDLNFNSYVTILGEEFKVSPGKNPFAISFVSRAENYSLVYLHNHPSTNLFSIGDIDTFVCEKAIKAMSVVTNQGEVYIMNKNADYSFSKAKALLNSVHDSFADKDIDDEEFVIRFLKRSREGGIEYVKAK